MEQKQVKQAGTLPTWTILVIIAGLILLFALGKSELARILMRMGWLQPKLRGKEVISLVFPEPKTRLIMPMWHRRVFFFSLYYWQNIFIILKIDCLAMVFSNMGRIRSWVFWSFWPLSLSRFLPYSLALSSCWSSVWSVRKTRRITWSTSPATERPERRLFPLPSSQQTPQKQWELP